MKTYLTRVPFLLAAAVALLFLLMMVAAPARAGSNTWVVTTGLDTDNDDGICPHATNCTLRRAILSASSGDTITFNISTNDPSYDVGLGFLTIEPIDDLNNDPDLVFPGIPGGVTIDGYTQPNAQPNTLGFGQGSNAVIKIHVDWWRHENEFGFTFAGNGATIKGLAITSAGIPLAIGGGGGGGDNNQILGNFIGTDPRGNVADGGGIGIAIGTDGANSNRIGSANPADKNVIVDQADLAILIYNTASNTIVEGNLIGLGDDGTSLPNGAGILIDETPGVNFIGGFGAGAGNIISGNTGWGIDVSPGSSAVIIAGNRIGTNLDGTSARPNGSGGIFLRGPDNIVGGQTANHRNVISGNGGPGIRSTNLRNIIEGNYIGTNAGGTAGIGNTHGIVIESADNVIGGTASGQRNVISGNLNNGVHVSGVGASGTTIRGNYVGTNAAGTAAVANSTGILISSANDVDVGGTANGAGNVLSGNFWGLSINSGNSNEVYGNSVGTNAAGTGAIPNTGEGILVNGNGNRIGGPDAAHANVLAFNASDGVRVTNGVGNPILRNAIHSNGGIGINLGTDGFTFNDPGDSDNGPNRLQNYPVLQSIDEDTLVLQMLLNSAPFVDYRIEFFRSDDCDPSTYGEGQVFLEAFERTMPALGVDNFQVNVSPSLRGAYLTTTATNNTLEDTSEFSNCILVPLGATPTPTPPGQTPTPTPSATATPTATPPGQTPTPTPTATPPGQTPTPTAPGQTPTPTAPQTATPTPPTGGLTLLLGDINCSGAVNPVDSLGVLRHDAGLSVNKDDPDCPDAGEPVQAAAAAIAAIPQGETIIWGDVDCDQTVNPVDSLKILRYDAGLSVSQLPGCPAIGEPLG